MRTPSTHPAILGLVLGVAVLIGVPVVWFVTGAGGRSGSVGTLPAPSAPAASSAGSPAASGQPASPPVPSPVPSASAARPTPASTPTPTPAAPPAAADPVAVTGLRVPAARVDAAVVSVGVAADGQAEVPADARRVGWYRFGPAPGEPAGNAVLIGHRDSQALGAGALFRMSAVRPGDRLSVVRADGRVLEYRTVAVRFYPKATAPWADVFSRTGPPALVVVTCGGPYDRARGGYQDNLVVTALPVSAPGAAT